MSVRAFRPESVRPPRGFTPFAPPAGALARAPLDLEIGCGVGFHPLRYAGAHPDRVLIAIEKTREKFGKFARRYATHGRPANLVPVHADAVAWVTHALGPASLSTVLIPYPNPNPKNPAQRWIRMPFFGYLLTRLKKNGRIVFYTNRPEYAEEVRVHAVRDWSLRVVRDLELTKEDFPDGNYRTHFEKKYLERGERGYEIELRF